MAVMTHDGVHRGTSRVLSVLALIMGVVVSTARTAAAPHKASFANLRAVPLTVGGTACIDVAAFHVASPLGWLVTGISLIVLEHIIADEAL